MGIFDFFRSIISGVFDPFQEAEPWFSRQNIDLDSIKFSAYDDAGLAANDEAVVLVGSGDTKDGQHIGFAIEVVPRRGVVAGGSLEPSGIATWHKKAAAVACLSGKTLIAVLNEYEHQHLKRLFEEPEKPGSSRDNSTDTDDQGAAADIDLVPGISAPAIVGGTQACSYRCGDYRAIVSNDNKAVGPIQYPFVLTVFRGKSDSPIMFVTAEKNTMASEMMELMPDNVKELLGTKPATGLVLGIFNQAGHQNLGKFDDISTLDGFVDRALTVMREKLHLSSKIQPS